MIKVISGGLYTTIQDLGRFGYRRLGIPLSGVMDSYSARLANRLVGNPMTDALLEITHIGPVLYFADRTEIAITGAGFSPTLNDAEISLNSRIFIPAKSTLKFGLPGYGLRAYLSIYGGFNVENELGSYSQYQGITSAETLEKGDMLAVKEFDSKSFKVTASVKVPKQNFTTGILEVQPGPEFQKIPKELQDALLSSELNVLPDSNRMAYLLDGWSQYSAKEIITAPVQPGTIQLTPSGQCVVLMRDAQTTGGYARVFQLTESAINILSQKKSGSKLSFKLK